MNRTIAISRSFLARGGQALLTALGVSLLVFLCLRLVPGDPVDLMLGEAALPAQRETMRTQLGLDRPVAAQFAAFYGGLIRGDLGASLTLRRPVSSLIAERLPYTVLLAVCAALLANLLGVPAGLWSAYRPRGAVARTAGALSTIFLSMPTFWMGPLLILALSLRWPWLPVSSFNEWSAIVLPTLTLGLGMAAVLCRTTAAAADACFRSEYVRTARAKGAGDLRILLSHVLPNAAVPVLTVAGLQFGHLLAGAVVTEAIFDWPGLGSLLYDAISQRDYPTVQGTVLVVAGCYVVLNLLTDFLNARFRCSDE